MSSIFSLPAATIRAAEVDRIFYLLLLLSGATVVLVFGLVLILAIRYRRGSAARRGPLPEIVSRELEIGWTTATLFAFAFLFWWASSADLSRLSAPANALEIHVVAKQWMWKTQQPNGAREINALHIPVGLTVNSISYTGAVPASLQSITVSSDENPGNYDAYTVVSTRTSKVSVTAYMSANSTVSTQTSGHSGQTLHSHLHVS